MLTRREHVTRISGSRWSVIRELIGQDTDSVLDVGCRGRELARFLPAESDYVGLDLFPPAEVIASAEEPLPFADDSFETVVLADVLEHLNNPHAALAESMRVARCAVVVLLPNLYSLWLRIRYMAGRTSGKYEFGPENPIDRHRWVMNFTQAAAFTDGCARDADWKVARAHGYDGDFTRLIARAAYAAARVGSGPDVWAWEYAARLEPAVRPSQSESPGEQAAAPR